MPLLKWKPASDVTAFRRQEANNELFIADEREKNAVNKKHRRTLVSSPPIYAGNGIWDDLRQLWGYYGVGNIQYELDRPCTGVSFPSTTFFMYYGAGAVTNFILGSPVTDASFTSSTANKGLTIIPYNSATSASQPASVINTIVKTRGGLIDYLNSYFAYRTTNLGSNNLPLVTASIETNVTTGTKNVLTLRCASNVGAGNLLGMYFGQGSHAAYTLGIVAPLATPNDAATIPYSGLFIPAGKTFVQANYSIDC